jgi:hypothetical protein
MITYFFVEPNILNIFFLYRVLDALTDHLGIPWSLRVCFALEVARLQLTLLLFTKQSIVCDRNCEGNTYRSYRCNLLLDKYF